MGTKSGKETRGGFVPPSHTAAKAGVEGLRLHDLRHAFATAALSQGVHPKVVSEALGHASIVITLDRYSHVLPSMGSLAADAIQRAFDAAAET